MTLSRKAQRAMLDSAFEHTKQGEVKFVEISGARFLERTSGSTQSLGTEEFFREWKLAQELEYEPVHFSGRGRPGLFVVGNQRVLLREYRRGGWLGGIVKRKFLNSPLLIPRPFGEHLVLSHLRSAGVSVPNPIASVVSYGFANLMYSGMILTEFIEDGTPLLDLAKSRTAEAFEAAFRAGREARKAISAGVRHIDLHVGNILVNSSNEVYLIDFDKAQWIPFGENTEKNCRLLEERFTRSVVKRGLSPELSQRFSRGLHTEDE